jgi:hypothetical protein
MRILGGPVALAIIVSAASAISGRAAGSTNQNPFCSRVGSQIGASSGALMYCLGPQPSGTSSQARAATSVATSPTFGSNADAADPAEDVTPAGVQAYGQSETSIAAVGPYVVEGWNDATGFFTNCPAPMHKEELTGIGFSGDGGTSFADEGGLPNNNCSADRYFGDPSVEGWRSHGTAYFYISSLFDSPDFTGLSYIALAACKATGSGGTAQIACGQPVIAAESSECSHVKRALFCSFLDKEYLSIDAKRGRLYVTYTDFGLTPASPIFNGNIDLAVCDIGTPSGSAGPSGGTAASPVCLPGFTPLGSGAHASAPSHPYFVVAPSPPYCENEGAYPAVDAATGDVYVAYEFNWASNIFGPSPCFSTPTKEVLTRVAVSCLTLTPVSPCAGPTQTTSVNIVSLDAAFIPGYNRNPAGPAPAADFPRIAVADAKGTVSIVWNDAVQHPTGDIFLRSYALGTLATVQPAAVRLNTLAGVWNFLPGLRNSTDDGLLNVGWFGRSSAQTAVTDYRAALDVDPRISVTPSANTTVSNTSSDWNNDSSDIIPNFGDYTDTYVISSTTAPYTGDKVYFAWSDGRLGLPQPFEANALAE